MTQPRLFADYAALPTARDRALLRSNNERHQLALIEPNTTTPNACPVCAGAHTEPDCTHGTAPTLIHPSPLACDRCGRTTYYCNCRNTTLNTTTDQETTTS